MKYLQAELDIEDLSTLNFCVICDQETIFKIPESFWDCRENLVCTGCNSTPRERNLMSILRKFNEEWWKLKIHEFCPLLQRGISWKLDNSDLNYSYTIPENNGIISDFNLNEDAKNSEVFILQDVFPYFIDPKAVLNSIYENLSDDGVLIITVPLLNAFEVSKKRVSRNNKDEIEYLDQKIIHKNQLNKEGALVCYDWGFDITSYISKNSKFNATLFIQSSSNLLITGNFNDVVFCSK